MEPRGQIIRSRYAVEALLGEGGDALVYRATDRHLRRTVAVKLLRPELRADPTFVARFEREARSAGSLNHPHIVPVYDYGEALDTYFLVMEYVAGGDLRARLRPGVPLGTELTVRLGAEVAAALGAAHALGIVHRDVKPANILLMEDGRAKVTDFGIAKMLAVPQLTATAAILGTPHYLAPEQATGEAVTPATDVYSLGVVLYEMLAGRRPFEGESFVRVAMQHLNTVPPALGDLNATVSPALAGVVARALAKDPAARFADGAALAAALRELEAPRRARVAGAASAAAAPRWAAASGAWPVPAPPRPTRDRTAGVPSRAAATPGGAPLPVQPQPSHPAAPPTGASAGAAARQTAQNIGSLPARLHDAVSAAQAWLRPLRHARPGATPAAGAADAPAAGVAAVLRARRLHSRRDPYTTTAAVAVAVALVTLGVAGARSVVGTLREESPAAAEAPPTPSTPPMVATFVATLSTPRPAPPEPTVVSTMPAVALEPETAATPPPVPAAALERAAAHPPEPTAPPPPPPTVAAPEPEVAFVQEMAPEPEPAPTPEPTPAPPRSAPPPAPRAVAALTGRAATSPAPDPPPEAPPARAAEVSAPEPAPEPAPAAAAPAPAPAPEPAAAAPSPPAAPPAQPAAGAPSAAPPRAQPPAAQPRAGQAPVPPAPVMPPPYPPPWGPVPMGPVPPMLAPPGMVPPYLYPPGAMPPMSAPIATPQPPPQWQRRR